MKRIVLFLLLLSTAFGMQAQYYKHCTVCGGRGNQFARDAKCPGCDNGLVPMSETEVRNMQRDFQQRLDNADRLMSQYSLQPDEVIAYQNIIKAVMREPNPDYREQMLNSARAIIEFAQKREQNSSSIDDAGHFVEDPQGNVSSNNGSGKSNGGKSSGGSSSSDDESNKNAVLGLMVIIAGYFGYRYYKKKKQG